MTLIEVHVNAGLLTPHVFKNWELIGKGWQMTSWCIVRHLYKKYSLNSDATNWQWHKMHKTMLVALQQLTWLVYFPPLRLLYITLAYHEFRKRFMLILIKIAQTMQNTWHFIVGKSSLYWRNGKLWRLSGRFYTLIWRPGDTVQNLEYSPRLSGRIDSSASLRMLLECTALNSFTSATYRPSYSEFIIVILSRLTLNLWKKIYVVTKAKQTSFTEHFHRICMCNQKVTSEIRE